MSAFSRAATSVPRNTRFSGCAATPITRDTEAGIPLPPEIFDFSKFRHGWIRRLRAASRAAMLFLLGVRGPTSPKSRQVASANIDSFARVSGAYQRFNSNLKQSPVNPLLLSLHCAREEPGDEIALNEDVKKDER